MLFRRIYIALGVLHLLLGEARQGVLCFALFILLHEAACPELRVSGQPICPSCRQSGLALLHCFCLAALHLLMQLGYCCILGFRGGGLHLRRRQAKPSETQ